MALHVWVLLLSPAAPPTSKSGTSVLQLITHTTDVYCPSSEKPSPYHSLLDLSHATCASSGSCTATAFRVATICCSCACVHVAHCRYSRSSQPDCNSRHRCLSTSACLPATSSSARLAYSCSASLSRNGAIRQQQRLPGNAQPRRS